MKELCKLLFGVVIIYWMFVFGSAVYAAPDDLRAGWTAVTDADGTRFYQVTCTSTFEGEIDSKGDMIKAQCINNGAIQAASLIAERAKQIGSTDCTEFWPEMVDDNTCLSTTELNYWTAKEGQFCFAAVSYKGDEESKGYSPITCRTVGIKPPPITAPKDMLIQFNADGTYIIIK